jgi:hypothetical protein
MLCSLSYVGTEIISAAVSFGFDGLYEATLLKLKKYVHFQGGTRFFSSPYGPGR